MTREEIKKIIDEKQKNGIIVSTVYGNTNTDSDLGYQWEYYIDAEIYTEEYEDEDYNDYFEEFVVTNWYLYFYHCGNGKGCFGVYERYECIDEDDAYNKLKDKALYGNCAIKFTDGTIINA